MRGLARGLRLGQHTGCMVALFLPRPEDLSLDGGEPPEDLHITLAYLGDSRRLDQQQVIAAVEEWALRTPRLSGSISGSGVFTEGPSPVSYLSVDMPRLPEAREALVRTLESYGLPVSKQHGFTPHITLDYARRKVEVPSSYKLRFGHAVVAFGGDRIHVPFKGAVELSIGRLPGESLDLAIRFDPRLHPRDFRGRFRETLDILPSGGNVRLGTPVSQLPPGTNIRTKSGKRFRVGKTGNWTTVHPLDADGKVAGKHTVLPPHTEVEVIDAKTGRRTFAVGQQVYHVDNAGGSIEADPDHWGGEILEVHELPGGDREYTIFWHGSKLTVRGARDSDLMDEVRFKDSHRAPKQAQAGSKSTVAAVPEGSVVRTASGKLFRVGATKKWTTVYPVDKDGNIVGKHTVLPPDTKIEVVEEGTGSFTPPSQITPKRSQPKSKPKRGPPEIKWSDVEVGEFHQIKLPSGGRWVTVEIKERNPVSHLVQLPNGSQIYVDIARTPIRRDPAADIRKPDILVHVDSETDTKTYTYRFPDGTRDVHVMPPSPIPDYSEFLRTAIAYRRKDGTYGVFWTHVFPNSHAAKGYLKAIQKEHGNGVVHELPAVNSPRSTRTPIDWEPGSVKAMFGEKLFVDERHSSSVQDHLKMLEKLPRGIARRLAAANVKIHVADRTVPDMDDAKHLRSVQPRGYAAGLTWNDSGGAWSPGSKWATAGSNRYSGSASTVLHELGHAFGHVMQVNWDDDLLEHHQRLYDKKKLKRYFRQDGRGGPAGRQELLAESFAEYLRHGKSYVADKYDAEYADWLEEVIQLHDGHQSIATPDAVRTLKSHWHLFPYKEDFWYAVDHAAASEPADTDRWTKMIIAHFAMRNRHFTSDEARKLEQLVEDIVDGKVVSP